MTLLANARASDRLELSVKESRIIAPGGKIETQLICQPGADIRYDLSLRDEMTQKIVPLEQVAFAASANPEAKKLKVPLAKEGLYALLAREEGATQSVELGRFLAAADVASPSPTPAVKAQPTLRLAGIFHDGVVLQREKPLPVWGWAQPGEQVTVQLAGQKEIATVDATGRWQVQFQPLDAGGPHELKATSASGVQALAKNVLVGEVWLLSGQSNMGGELPGCLGGQEAAANADFPEVRLGPVLGSHSPTGSDRLEPVWWMEAASGGDSAKMQKWGGIHYTFGTELYKALGVPIGLVAASRGGTSLSTWTSHDVHESEPIFRPILDQYRQEREDHVVDRQYLGRLGNDIAKWRKASEEAARTGKPAPTPPKLSGRIEEKNAPGLLYDQLIEPLAPFAIRGVLWYQGENDTGRAEAYRGRFPIMIASWRKLWGDPQLPFIFVQLAFNSGRPQSGQPDPEPPGNAGWAELREAQTLTLRVPHTAMVVSYDLVQPEDDVHYKDKIPVGHRLALAALATVYDKPIEFRGPTFRALKKEGHTLRLSFDHAEGSLQAKGGALRGFAIAGEDRKWVWADARIDGDTVILQSEDVPDPVAARYAWTTTAQCGANLYNRAGLPAPCFRTDDWPLSSAGER